jgi:hypothetical protein
MVWKGIQVHDVPTKDPNHPFPTITIDLDTSYNRFWMVWKGIQVHDVMQQAGFCVAGCRKKFSWQDLTQAIVQATNQQKTHKPSLPNHHN